MGDRQGKVFLDCKCGNEHEVEPGTFVSLYCECGRRWQGFIPQANDSDPPAKAEGND